MTIDQTKRPTIRVGRIAVVSGTLRRASVVNADLLIGGAKALKGFKLDDVLAGLKTNLTDLGSKLSTSLRGIDLDVDIELPGTNRGDGTDTPGGNPGIIDDNPATGRGDDGRATDNVNRDLDMSNEHPRSEQQTNTHQSETPAQQPVVDLVREHELVGAGAPGSPSTHHGGGGTQLIDNGDDSHSGSGGGHGSGGSGSGGHDSGGDGSGGHGTGGHGGSGDGTPGGPGNGSGGGDNSGGHGSGGSGGSGGGSNVPNTPLGSQVANQPNYRGSLASTLDDLKITPAEFDRLVDTPFDQLSKPELETLMKIRTEMPDVTPDTVLQKIIPPADVHRVFEDIMNDLLNSDPSVVGTAERIRKFDEIVAANPDVLSGSVGKYEVSSVGGFVSRSADVSDLTTSELFDSLGLGYKNTPFSPSGQNYYAIQCEAGNLTPSRADYTLESAHTHFEELSHLSGYDYQIRLAEFVEQDFRATQPPGALSDAASAELKGRVDYALNAVNGENVHRGNGFGGQPGTYDPELQLFEREAIPDGAELWRIAPNGNRVTIAVFDEQRGIWTVP